MVNGLNIVKIIWGLVPTRVNCKEAAVHLQPPMPTPPWICLLTGIWTVLWTWDKIKVVLFFSYPTSGEKNVSTGNTGRETGMLVAQTQRAWVADVSSTCPGGEGEHSPTGSSCVLKDIRKVANRRDRYCLCPQSSELRCHHSPTWDLTGSCNILAGVKVSWSVVSSFRCLMIHSIHCETPCHRRGTWGFPCEPW